MSLYPITFSETAESILPSWLRLELDKPANEGGRNQQMFRLAPALLRARWSEKHIFDQFRSMYDDDVEDGEIEKLISRAAERIATQRNTTSSKSAWAKRQRELNRCEGIAASRSLTILNAYPWPEEAILCDSPIALPQEPVEQTRLFLHTLWHPTDTIWIGATYDSGQSRHKALFRPAGQWLKAASFIGEFTCASAFVPGSFSRSNETIEKRRFFVVESDVLSRNEVGAIFRWLNKTFRLRAVVFSGNKSLHGWFDWPAEQELDELQAVIKGLRCDPNTLRAAQPVRLPGAHRRDKATTQTLLYLQELRTVGVEQR